ncbi:putative MxaK-like protein [Paraburkholderia ribeironis]|uniref:Putative MxaK-like protein n=1 Tax=Paraburkholderia ribeironis TaxID=1247936 RepID=A0A1N7S8X0_9BURK|nr:hypothetical protein [Paraburkholderia ribeironis]SIT43771.1 putative MxaK-like protein [Paraburkholderia ribeironis]
MKRRSIHLLFAAATLCGAAWCAYQGWLLQRALDTNAAVVRASEKPSGENPNRATANDVAEVRLARAVALSKAGKYDAASNLFNELGHQEPLGETGRAALFDLANMYMREGIANGAGKPGTSTPLIELAKQRYRDLLRVYPDNWDARYNLERALWLRPEHPDAFDAAAQQPHETRKLKLQDVTAGDLP